MDFGTAHAKGIAKCENGHNYVVKDNSTNSFACANEYFCSSLADSLNLPILPFKALQGKDGSLVFGSQLRHPIIPTAEAARILMSQPGNQTIKLENGEDVLSAIFAFDLLVANPDRHEDNYLITENASTHPQRSGSINVIDFEGANVLGAQVGGTKVMGPGSPTIFRGNLIRNAHGFSLQAAESLLNMLEKGQDFLIERALTGMPKEWLPDNERNRFLDQIKNGLVSERLEHVRKGLKNGVYA